MFALAGKQISAMLGFGRHNITLLLMLSAYALRIRAV